MSSDSDDRTQGLSLKTLVISSLAALVAAIVVSLFWEQGTLIATAITPILVALAREGLARPADKLEDAASTVASKAPLATAGKTDPDSAQTDKLAESKNEKKSESEDDKTSEPQSEQKDRPDGTSRNRRIKIALITGVLAFAIAAVVLTVSELTTGESLGTDSRTTLFGGSKDDSSSPDDGKSESDQTPKSTTEQQDGAAQDDPAVPEQEPEEAPEAPEDAPPEEPAPTPSDQGETVTPSQTIP